MNSHHNMAALSHKNSPHWRPGSFLATDLPHGEFFQDKRWMFPRNHWRLIWVVTLSDIRTHLFNVLNIAVCLIVFISIGSFQIIPENVPYMTRPEIKIFATYQVLINFKIFINFVYSILLLMPVHVSMKRWIGNFSTPLPRK